MELSILDSKFRRSKTVENWGSLIWTERFSSNGDFELESNNIGEVMKQLPPVPEGSPDILVAIDGSDVPMVVETHKIEKPKTGPPKITISGRSWESVLDRRQAIRAVTTGVKRNEWQVEATSAAMAAYTVINEIVVLGAATPLDIIPEFAIFNGTSDVGVSVKYAVEPKELYAWVIETLALGTGGTGKYGMKSVLPLPSDATTQIPVTIYKGNDLRTSVVFDVALEAIEEATYLLSKLGYKNVMITATANGMEFSTTGTDPSGLRRRVDFQNLESEITVPVGADLTQLTINKGKVALADRLPTALFSGGVAQSVGSGYGSKYFLGDIVKLAGEYGLSQDARVAEFVRTHDATGQKAYPTFEAVTL